MDVERLVADLGVAVQDLLEAKVGGRLLPVDALHRRLVVGQREVPVAVRVVDRVQGHVERGVGRDRVDLLELVVALAVHEDGRGEVVRDLDHALQRQHGGARLQPNLRHDAPGLRLRVSVQREVAPVRLVHGDLQRLRDLAHLHVHELFLLHQQRRVDGLRLAGDGQRVRCLQLQVGGVARGYRHLGDVLCADRDSRCAARLEHKAFLRHGRLGGGQVGRVQVEGALPQVQHDVEATVVLDRVGRRDGGRRELLLQRLVKGHAQVLEHLQAALGDGQLERLGRIDAHLGQRVRLWGSARTIKTHFRTHLPHAFTYHW